MLSATNPKKIFLMAGTNDLRTISFKEYTARYMQLIKTIKESMPNASIYIQSVLPTNHSMANYAPNKKIQKANIILKDIAKDLDCTYIDLYSLYVNSENELNIELTRDGVHLFPQSYNIWAKAIEKYIYE